MGLEALKPEMPSLSEYGLSLYKNMIDCEREAVLNIPDSVAWLFKEHVDVSAKIPVNLRDYDPFDAGLERSTRGKILVVAKPGFDYQALIDELYHSRREFSNYLQIQANIQQIKANNIGTRSTAAPEIINFMTDEITYSHNQAYRSSKLTIEDIDYLISEKIESLEESIDTSKSSRQHSRIERYEQRIDQLLKDYTKLKKIVESTTIIGRVRSGDALKLRAKNDAGYLQFGIKNICIIYSNSPIETILKPSNTHKRQGDYGVCLLEIEELRLEIYAAQTVH
jgi:hypothetical protein